MNTDDPKFRDRVREIVRDAFLRGDDENAIRMIRDWRLFDDLADIACDPETNFGVTVIGNVFEGVSWLTPRAPVTGLSFTLTRCRVLANDSNFIVQQTPKGVLEILIRNMDMALSGTDVSPELQLERAEHGRTRARLERVQEELSYWRNQANDD